MERLTLTVPDLHCEGCVETVCGVLGLLGGVAEVEGDLDRKTITVLQPGGREPHRHHGQPGGDRIPGCSLTSGRLGGVAEVERDLESQDRHRPA